MFNFIWKNLLNYPYLLGVLSPMLILGIFSIYSFFLNFDFIKVFYFILGYFVFNILGITAGYHRYFSHRSFVLNSKWKKRLLLWAGTLSGQGSVIFWVALHRGYHHRNTDTFKDPHSPIYGFWHSFIFWLFKINPLKINPKYSIELIQDKEIRFIHENYVKICLIFNSILFLIDLDILLFFSIMPTFVTLITYGTTNSLCHMNKLGYKNFNTRDNSINIPWLFPVLLGECWHNNHHNKPGMYHFGSKISNNWWEFDPAGSIIKIIKD